MQEENTVQDIDLFSRNKDLAEALGLIASYYYIARDTYRARTYANASAQISAYPVSITSGGQARRELSRIGPSVETDIDSFINTYNIETGAGLIPRLQELETKFSNVQQVVNYFKSFYGIGPVTAVKFYNLGYRTLEDLWFKANLTDAQKLGIMWRDHINLRIPRDEMNLIQQKLSSILDLYKIRWSIVGSYRREEPSSGDIDVLVESRPDLNMSGLTYLLKDYIPAILAQGPTKLMGIFRLDDQHNGHRIDIRLIESKSYGAALMYFTGSQKFNILMRRRAIDMGMTLNEYGLYLNNGQLVPTTTEEDIFTALRVKYMSPIERINTLDHLTYF